MQQMHGLRASVQLLLVARDYLLNYSVRRLSSLVGSPLQLIKDALMGMKPHRMYHFAR